jgi:hypothetical protein
MDLHFSVAAHDLLSVHLADGDQTATVTVTPSRAGLESLRRAFQSAVADGYGECFWPAPTGGQYWWVFKRDAETMEIAAMWTRGGASLWEHVFRATDAAGWIGERLDEEIQGLTRRRGGRGEERS